MRDIPLHLLNAIFTVSSCGLSGYAGWLLASDLGLVIQCITALCFSSVAFGLSFAVVGRHRYELARDRAGYERMTRLAYYLLAANLITDFSASSALRDQSMVTTKNVNQVAQLADDEVERIEKAMAELRRETAWRTKYDAPEAYSALIAQQKQVVDRGANVYARTKQCTDTTLPVSSQVCQRIKELEGEKAMAERRQVILAELKTLGEQLAQARQEAANKQERGNAAIAPIIGLYRFLTGSSSYEQAKVEWGLSLFVIVFTGIMSAAIWFFSSEVGTRLGPMEPPEPRQRRQRRPDNYWLPAPEAPPPIALESVDIPRDPQGGAGAGGTSVTVYRETTKANGYDRDEISRIKAELAREIARDAGLDK